MSHVLLVDDDPDIIQPLKDSLLITAYVLAVLIMEEICVKSSKTVLSISFF